MKPVGDDFHRVHPDPAEYIQPKYNVNWREITFDEGWTVGSWYGSGRPIERPLKLKQCKGRAATRDACTTSIDNETLSYPNERKFAIDERLAYVT